MENPGCEEKEQSRGNAIQRGSDTVFRNCRVPMHPPYLSEQSAFHSTDFRFFHFPRDFRSDLREFCWFFPHWTAVCSEVGKAVGSDVEDCLEGSGIHWATGNRGGGGAGRHVEAVSVWSREGSGIRV